MVEHDDTLLFEEDPEEQLITCTTPKRKLKIKIFVPIGQFSRWKIRYEDGTAIEGLDGYWLSRLEAIRALRIWEVAAKKTDLAKKQEIFGDRKPPVLKRKKRGPAAQAING